VTSKQQSPTPAAQDKRPTTNQTAEPTQAGLTPEVVTLAAMGSSAQNGLPPNHPTAARLRQATVLQMQRRHGNAYVQRMLARQTASEEVASSDATVGHLRMPDSSWVMGGNGINGVGTAVQRQEGEEAEGDTPTEAEKAAALAAAAAAEAVAGSAASEGKQKTAKSRAEKAKEQEAGQTAKEEAGQKSAAAKAKAGEVAAGAAGGATAGAAGVNGAAKTAGEAAAGGAAAGAKGGGKVAKAGVNGAGAAVDGAGPEGKAPASPEEDPAFQAVTGKVKQVGKAEKTHDPAEKKAGEAQAAAESPASETEAKAQANQVGKMEQAETPGFDAAGFKAKLMERIASMAPKSAKEADDFKESNKVAGVKDEMKGQAAAEQDKSKKPVEEATAAAPDTAGVAPKPVTPLPATEAGEAAGDIGAEGAAPKPKTASEVEKPIQENTKQVDEKMAEADVSDEQLEKSNEPEFQGALQSKKEAKEHAATAPADYRQAEQQQVAQAQGQAAETTNAQLQGMHGDKAQALQQVVAQQGQTKSEDERERQKVAADIQKIYAKTKTNVEKILGELDGKVDQAFDSGAAEAKKAFEDYVEAKMNAYKERRYGGWFGWARWAKDKLAGMPGEVNAFYAEGRDLYLGKMDAVIDNVVAIIGRTLAEAKREIAKGKQEIQDYVVKLPQNLRQVGQQAAEQMQSKFSELEQSVDNKQNELIDRLAQKYQENLQAIDSRIEELKAANKGLVGAALDAIAGVIKTILKLKDMLLNVLSRAADAIGKILKDPIGFLGNLLSAVKKGLSNFVSNIGTHLKKGLMTWLFGEVAKAGIQLPESFDMKGILTLVMQLLGLTWENLRARAVKMFGERVVSALEKAFEIFKIIKEKGIGGLWEFIKEKLSNLKDMVMDGIKDMVITQVIKAGISWLMGVLGGPAGAFIKAAKAIYDVVMWFINNGSQLMSLVEAIIGSISAIASGAIDSAAKFVEDSLAKAIPVVIGFLASLLGLGGFADKIKAIIQKIQEPINRAIDWVLDKAKAIAKKVGGFFGIGKDKDKGDNAAAIGEARQRVAARTKQPFKDQQELNTTVNQIETDLKPKGLKSLNIKPKEGMAGQFDVIAREESADVGDATVTSGETAPFTVGQKIQYRKKAGKGSAWSEATVEKIENGKVDLTLKSRDARGEIGAVTAAKDIPLASFVQGETWQPEGGSTDDLAKMKEAVGEAGGIVAFMKVMAKGGKAKEIDRTEFNRLYVVAEIRGWLADAFRGADKGKHEWIPSEMIDQVVARAANPEQFFEGMKWIDLQHKLRVDTTWVIFKPERWGPTPYRPLISDTGARGEEREYIIPDGHPGALTLLGPLRPLTTGEGPFHEELKNAFQNSSTIEGYINALLDVITKWVWAGEGVPLPLFPGVYYKGKLVEDINELAAAHQRNYIDTRLEIIRVKREVLGG
jgi:hypothetical protein